LENEKEKGQAGEARQSSTGELDLRTEKEGRTKERKKRGMKRDL
jgi:hypothetical protein